MDEQTIIIRVSVLLLESTFERVNVNYLHVGKSHRLSSWLPQAQFGLLFIIIKNNQFRQTTPAVPSREHYSFVLCIREMKATGLPFTCSIDR